jgi:hypothetical protein
MLEKKRFLVTCFLNRAIKKQRNTNIYNNSRKNMSKLPASQAVIHLISQSVRCHPFILKEALGIMLEILFVAHLI